MANSISATSFEDMQAISGETNRIMLALMDQDNPVLKLVDLYERAKDKHIFVLALAAALVMRQNQWLAATEK